MLAEQDDKLQIELEVVLAAVELLVSGRCDYEG